MSEERMFLRHKKSGRVCGVIDLRPKLLCLTIRYDDGFECDIRVSEMNVYFEEI